MIAAMTPAITTTSPTPPPMTGDRLLDVEVAGPRRYVYPVADGV